MGAKMESQSEFVFMCRGKCNTEWFFLEQMSPAPERLSGVPEPKKDTREVCASAKKRRVRRQSALEL